MLPAHVFADRRRRLLAAVPGPILLPGMGTRARNLPMNVVPFRQDSTFLYLTGCDLPDCFAWLEDGQVTLYATPPADDDDLWHGHTDTPEDLAARYAVDAVRDVAELPARARSALPRTLAIADESVNRTVTQWTGTPLRFGRALGDDALVDAVIALRRTKDAVELEALAHAAAITADAHRLVMAATRPGIHERSLAALFDAYLASRGAVPGYDTILTQRGEVLHNHAHDAVCEAGRLLLLDGGAEVRTTGYGADVTRTWPVSGRYDGRQRAAYEAVLASQLAAIDATRAGVRYRHVHDTASLVLAQFLVDEGLLRHTNAEDVVARHAHALFFPHGVGHLLGLDVHDLEAFGDRAAYPPGATRDPHFGTAYLRLDLPLEAGWVVTIEPGFYVVPAILHKPAFREAFGDILDLDRIAAWSGFGGIRIEDDVVVTDGDPTVLTAAIPKSVADVEAIVGSGAPLEVLLS